MLIIFNINSIQIFNMFETTEFVKYRQFIIINTSVSSDLENTRMITKLSCDS